LSSILRALKKLDEDAIADSGQGVEHKVKMKRMVNRRVQKPLILKRTLLVSSTVTLMVVVVWVIGGLRSHPRQTDASPRHPVKESSLVVKEKYPPPPTAKETILPAAAVSTEAEQIEETKVMKSGDGEKETAWNTGSIVPEPAVPIIPEKREMEKKKGRPDFVLDGIIWSTEPGRRLVSINDRYLKEGDMVNGVMVVKIDKAEVTLRLNEDTWTIYLKK
jgi:hypothetical protein